MTLPARVKMYDRNNGRAIVICPNCGENNSNTFRFCGMCGTLLEARRPANAAVPAGSAPKISSPQEPQRPIVLQNVVQNPAQNTMQNAPEKARPVSRQVPPISGPSMLGLNQTDPNPPVVNRPSFDQVAPIRPGLGQQPGLGQPNLGQQSLGQSSLGQSDLGQYGFNQPGPVRSAMDSIPDRSFTGLQSFFEPEQPKKNGALRVLLLVVLLAALAGAGWWTYGYLDNTEGRKPATATAKNPSTTSEGQNAAPSETSNNTLNNTSNIQPSATTIAQNSPSSPNAAASPAPAASATAPETPSNTANAGPDGSTRDVEAGTKPAPKSAPAIPKVALGDKSAESRSSHVTAARALKPPAPAATDSGTADFQKGEAYLYGRGAHENCDEAVKYLKSASAKSNAKAKSAFGTMYATGHCVARDLPTSYLWFAMALREDPNNQILEKDLSAIWNQMTPPERQLATRMKQ
jgi:hypothetical protein